MDKASVGDACNAGIITRPTMDEILKVSGYFEFQCFGPDGKLKWEDDIRNVVTTLGKNDILDKYLGITSVAGIFMGLISNTSYAAGVLAADTMASHTGWTEAATNQPTYSQATRPAVTFGAAALGVKLSNTVVFSITAGSASICKGSFITTDSAKAGTAGLLVAGGTFTAGDKTVSNGDTLNGTYQLTLT
jgi:hypothetical protein